MAKKKTNPNYDFVWQGAKDESVRYIRLEGGTRSGKTFSVEEVIIEFCFKFKSAGFEFAVARKTLAALKSTALKDFINTLKKWDLYKDVEHNKTDNIFRIGTNVISFFGADNDDKLRGFSCDILYCNEALELTPDEWLQLKIRTRHKIIIDYNPSEVSHFLYDELDGDAKCKTLVTTYKDNPHLPQAQIEEIEKLETIDITLWSIYGDGQRGQLKGLIFTNWEVVSELPSDLRKDGYGLDFGFSNDPTALIYAGIYQGNIYVDELIYEKNLTNQDIVQKAKPDLKRNTLICADSAEPKSIEEIKRMGVFIQGVVKKKGSVNHTISLLKQYKIFITKRSVNLKKELSSYKWKEVNGIQINEPVDAFNHGIDALRYYAFKNLSLKVDVKGIKRTN